MFVFCGFLRYVKTSSIFVVVKICLKISLSYESANIKNNKRNRSGFYSLTLGQFSRIYIYIILFSAFLWKTCLYCLNAKAATNNNYIGETIYLRNRVPLHNQYIRVPELRKIPVSGHIADCSDREPKYFIFPFYQMRTESIIKEGGKREALCSNVST